RSKKRRICRPTRRARYGCAILGPSMPTDCPRSLFHLVSPAPDCQSVCKLPDHALAREECWRLLTLLSRLRIGINALRRYLTCCEVASNVMRTRALVSIEGPHLFSKATLLTLWL